MSNRSRCLFGKHFNSKQMENLRFQMAVHQEDALSIAAELLRECEIDFISSGEPAEYPPNLRPDTWKDYQRRLEKIMADLDLQRPVSSFHQVDFPSMNDIENQAEEFIKNLESDLARRDQEICGTQDSIDRLEQQIQQIRVLSEVDIDPASLKHVQCLRISVGWIPTSQIQSVKPPLKRTPVLILPKKKTGEKYLIVALAALEHGFVLERVLESIFFQPIADSRQNIKETDANELETRLHEQKQLYSKIRNDFKQMASEKEEELAGWWNRISVCLNVSRSIDAYLKDRGCCVLRGQVNEADADVVADRVGRTGNPYALITGTEPEGA